MIKTAFHHCQVKKGDFENECNFCKKLLCGILRHPKVCYIFVPLSLQFFMQRILFSNNSKSSHKSLPTSII